MGESSRHYTMINIHLPLSKTGYLRILSITIFLSGIITAAILYYAIDPLSSELSLSDPMLTKTHIHELKRFGGTFTVLTAELSHAIKNLGQGRNLAILIGVVATLVAIALWRLAAGIAGSKQED